MRESCRELKMIHNIPSDCIWFDKGNADKIAVECQDILKRLRQLAPKILNTSLSYTLCYLCILHVIDLEIERSRLSHLLVFYYAVTQRYLSRVSLTNVRESCSLET